MSNKTLTVGAIFIAVGLIIFVGVYNRSRGVAQALNPHTNIRSQANIGNDTGGQLALDFTLQKLGGGTILLSEFRGKKPVVVDFWASWCPNCRRDMPKMNAMYPKYKDKVEIIGINLQERESIVQDFIISRGISFPIALDPGGLVSRAYGIQYTNTHFLVDIEGNLVRQIPGDIQESDIISLIEHNS